MSQYASVESVGRKPLKSALVFCTCCLSPICNWLHGRKSGLGAARGAPHAVLDAGRHARSMPPDGRSWACLPPAESTPMRPGEPFREGRPCLLRPEGTPGRPVPGLSRAVSRSGRACPVILQGAFLRIIIFFILSVFQKKFGYLYF